MGRRFEPEIALTLLPGSDSFTRMSTHLKSRLRSDLVTARKARDRLRTVVMTTLLSDVRNREIALGDDLDDEGIQGVVAQAIKQRHAAAEQMRAGGRPELADKESAEAALLQEYLPPALSEAEVRDIVKKVVESGADQMGPVMGQIMPQIRGRFDGTEARRIVQEELG